MSEIENYKNILQELRTYYKPKGTIDVDGVRNEDKKYLPAIDWALNEGYINSNNVIRWPDEYGNARKIVFKSYPFTKSGDDFLKTDNEKQLKLATDEAVKSFGSEIGKWGIMGIALIILYIVISFRN